MRSVRYSKNISLFQLLLDLTCLVFLFFYFIKLQYIYNDIQITLSQSFKLHYKALILFVFSWYIVSFNVKLYEISRLSRLLFITKKNFTQIVAFSVIVLAVSGFKSSDLFSNRLSLYFLIALFISTLCSRVSFFILLKVYRRLGGNYRRVVFIDENSNTYSFIKLLLKRRDYGFINFGEFKVGIQDNQAKKRYSFDIKELKRFIIDNDIQIIFFSLNGKISEIIQKDVVRLAHKLHVDVRFIPGSIHDSFNTLKLEYYDTFPILSFNRLPLDSFWNRELKRSFDILFSLFVIIFLFSWLFPIIALLIFCDSGLPVFYKQKRIGLRGKPFCCYKFRTMKASKYNDVKATEKGDARITKIGKILRKTSLDELPQFFNVLLGNMSVVGPRPHMVLQDEYYQETLQRYSLRHYVNPGITGLAQVKGFRGEISSKEDIQKRIIADVYYVRNWSFLLDIIIIVRTFFKILGGDQKAF